ncbi:MAG: hypothetical protein HQL32_07500 [Planctomycetes bacterium]|nr:hypothetical protein [Planctomycetota bacterium]
MIPQDRFEVENEWHENGATIKQIWSGGDRNFAYILEYKGHVSAIDFGHGQELLKAQYPQVTEYLATHKHYDHLHDQCRDETSQNSALDFVETIFTPGHTEESVCFLVHSKYLISGDTLFIDKIGGTSDEESARAQFESLKKLAQLDPEVLVLSGHNYGSKIIDTLGQQLLVNPFLLRLNSFEDFYWLKNNWAAYKIENGIK